MMNQSAKENLINSGIKFTKHCRSVEANEVMALSTDFSSDHIALIRNGMVRIEVIDSQRRIVSSEVYGEDTICSLPVNLTFLTKISIREIRVVALKAGTAIVFYDQVDFEMMLMKGNRDAYVLYKDLLNSLNVNLFSKKTYFLKDGVLIDQYVSELVKLQCKYLIMQESHVYLTNQLESATLKNSKEVPVLVGISRQDGFWVNLSVSQASFHRAQTQLIKQGVIIADPKYRESFSVCLDLMKLMQHYAKEYHEALDEIDNTNGHFTQLRQAMAKSQSGK